MVTMAKVESSDIHSLLHHSFELWHFPTCWTNGTDDFGATKGGFRRRLDEIQCHKASSKCRDFSRLGDTHASTLSMVVVDTSNQASK